VADGRTPSIDSGSFTTAIHRETTVYNDRKEKEMEEGKHAIN
jgi:hypothetical protein